MVTKYYPMEFQQCRSSSFESQQSEAGEQDKFGNALEPCKREDIKSVQIIVANPEKNFPADFYT